MSLHVRHKRSDAGCRSLSDVVRHAGFDPCLCLVQRTCETRNHLVHLRFGDDKRRAERDGVLNGADNKAVFVCLFEDMETNLAGRVEFWCETGPVSERWGGAASRDKLRPFGGLHVGCVSLSHEGLCREFFEIK
jgi:hypothetical protein